MDGTYDAWTRLKENMYSCRGCYLSGEKRILGCGNTDARIMIVGDIPSPLDLEKGEAFSGEVGKYVKGLLNLIDIDPDDVYMTYLVNCNGASVKSPKSEATEACINCLRRQFSLIKPEIVITLGRVAARKLISEDFLISRDHGKLFSKGKVMFMGTYNPTSFSFEKSFSKLMLDDFLVIKEFCDTYPQIKGTDRNS